MIPDIRKEIAAFDRSQASLACPDNSSTEKERSMEHCWNDSDKKLYTVLSYLGVFTFCTRCKIPICLVCIVASFMLFCVSLLLVGHVYCCSYLMCICCTVCALLFFLLPDCCLEVSIRKVLRPAISTQVFLGFPVPKSKCKANPKIPSCHYMLLM